MSQFTASAKASLPTIISVGLIIGAVVAYTTVTPKIGDQDYLLAAILLGAAGHLALAHVQGRLDTLGVFVVISLAIVGVVAGVVGVLSAKLANSDAATLPVAVAGLGAAIAGAETLTRIAARSLGTASVAGMTLEGDKLVITGQGWPAKPVVLVNGAVAGSSVAGNTLTITIPPGTPPGAPVVVGSDDNAVTLAVPAS